MTGPVSHFCCFYRGFLVQSFYGRSRRGRNKSSDSAVNQLQGCEPRSRLCMGRPLLFQKPTKAVTRPLTRRFWCRCRCRCLRCRCRSSDSGSDSDSSRCSRPMNGLRPRHAEPLGLSRQTPRRSRDMAPGRQRVHVRDDPMPVGGFRGALRIPRPPRTTVRTEVTIRQGCHLTLECAIDREGPATIRLCLTRAAPDAPRHVNRVRMVALPRGGRRDWQRSTHFDFFG